MTTSAARLLRYRLPILAFVAFIAGLIDASAPLQPFDLGVLTEAARGLTGGDLTDAYSDPRVQVGPLHLLVLGALAGATDLLGLELRLVFSATVHVGLCIGSMLVFRSLATGGSRKQDVLEVIVGATVIVGGLAWTSYIYGHPEEGSIGLIWLLAGQSVVRGRSRRAGVLIALAGGLKLWGFLGLPLLGMGQRKDVSVRSLAIAVAGGALLYAPLLLVGDVQTFAYRWPVDSPLIRVLLEEGVLFDWRMRVVQGGLVVAAGALIVWWLRARPGIVWAAPIGIVLLRILLDPLPHPYYWLPVAFVGLIGLATQARDAFGWPTLAIAALFYATLLGPYLSPATSFILHVAFTCMLVALARSSTSPSPASHSV